MADESVFHTSIRTLIGDWQGLQMAIEHGMGGPQAREKEQWLVDTLEQHFAENSGLHQDDVEDFIAAILDNEFDTIVEDGSLAQLSALLCKHYEMCRDGREREVLESLSQRLPQTRTLAIPMPGYHDSDDEAEMMEHINSTVSTQMNGLHLNGDSSSTPHRRDEPDEDGWTVVKHGKK
ncbi:pre-rRNA-processing protein TSR2 homolog [Ornithodoros turicata]|uniref:pre-rRNA-processing protein TSR2 homolog n=1 Tax=Ornithodoros turicata TaxID=34597 RepID=UPI003138B3C4